MDKERKLYEISTEQVIDYVENYIEFDEGCLYMTEEDWYDAIGIESWEEIMTKNGWILEDVCVTFDGEEIYDEGHLASTIGYVMAKYGEEHFGGNWKHHWCDGAIAAWDENLTTAGEIWGF
ncbi:MAG: hypothetical protein J6Y78_01865 [Paludibacteraceae bacterium]|nr:hypothetical protein [Paludibacteraceae bacterium]